MIHQPQTFMRRKSASHKNLMRVDYHQNPIECCPDPKHSSYCGCHCGCHSTSPLISLLSTLTFDRGEGLKVNGENTYGEMEMPSQEIKHLWGDENGLYGDQKHLWGDENSVS